MISHPSRVATSRNRSGVTPPTIETIGSTMGRRYLPAFRIPKPVLAHFATGRDDFSVTYRGAR